MINLIKTTDTKKENFVPGKTFNPNFDGNAICWYDGDLGLTAGGWIDQGPTGYNLTFFNNPTIVANATPLRDAVRFDGINQYGENAGVVRNFQPQTVYIVMNSVAWNSPRRVHDNSANTMRLYQLTITPNLSIRCAAIVDGNPDLAIGTWGVMTAVYDGLNSEIRTNLNASVIGNAGGASANGLVLGSTGGGGGQFCNYECGYLILRTGADSTAIQNQIIAGLEGLCGLTF